MSDNLDLEDHYEGSDGTGVLIPQAQIMEVLQNLNVSYLKNESHSVCLRCGKESSQMTI